MNDSDEDTVELTPEEVECIMESLYAGTSDLSARVHDMLTNESGKSRGTYRKARIIFTDE